MKVRAAGMVLGALWLVGAASANPYLEGMEAWRWGDFKSAREYWQKASDAGNAQAMFLLSQLLQNGQGGEADPDAALRWLRASAEAGYAVAQFNLGNHYQQGRGVSQDMKQAARWWRLAALQGLPQAQTNLGNYYYHGETAPQDLEQATWWYEQAAAQGSAQARQALRVLRVLRVLRGETTSPAGSDEQGAPAAQAKPDSLQDLALGPDWLLSQSPDHFTVQLLASTDIQAARKLLGRLQLDRKPVLYPFRRDGQLWYALLYGHFDRRAAANRAVEALPQRIRANGPWIRRIGDLPPVAGD